MLIKHQTLQIYLGPARKTQYCSVTKKNKRPEDEMKRAKEEGRVGEWEQAQKVEMERSLPPFRLQSYV